MLMTGCVSSTRTGQLFIATRTNHELFEGDGLTAAWHFFFGFHYFIATYTVVPVYDMLCMPYDLFLKCRGTKVYVIDEANAPVCGAKMDAWFNGDCCGRETDSDGMIRVPADLRKIKGWGVGALCSPFYRLSGCKIAPVETAGLFLIPTATVQVQRVEHPIPLWVKRELLNVKQEIANINGGKFSYDLMMGEWLPPFGKGKVADMEFTRIPHQDLGEVVGVAGVKGHSYRDAVAVKFVGADNGFVECRPPSGACLKIRTAPEDGYKPDYQCWRGRGSDLKYEMSYDEKRCFCFRIRTLRNDEGEIAEAYYGKIYSDIKIYTGYDHGIHGVLFAYYLNPTSLDRNLEWDRVHNLCTNPGSVGGSVGDRQP